MPSVASQTDRQVKREITVPGSLDSLGMIHEWMRNFLIECQLTETELHNTLLAVSEAVTNAIRHGCQERAGSAITISAEHANHEVVVKVQDCGNGFCPEDVPDPTESSYLHRSGGRGVFLLRSLSQSLYYDTSVRGTTVVFGLPCSH